MVAILTHETTVILASAESWNEYCKMCGKTQISCEGSNFV